MSSSVISQNIKNVVKNIPHKPGVYRYYNSQGDLLYVGKAKDLKNRVSTYFQEAKMVNQRLRLMVSQVDKIEYTVVKSEKESLILEANLIHNLQPKYNIQLRDDRSYLYVRITDGDSIPGVFLTRRKYDSKSTYFGPYTKRSGIRDSLRVIRLLLPYCQERQLQTRPCSYYLIGQCKGVCIGREDSEEYNLRLDKIKAILSGNTQVIVDFVKSKIHESIKNHNFELAAWYRDKLSTFENTVSDQKIVLPHPMDIDLITLIYKTTEEGLQIASIFVQNIRDGRIINLGNFIMSGSVEENSVFFFVDRFLSNYYVFQQKPDKIMIQTFELDKSK